MMTARRSNVRRLGVETLEPRVCLAASVGWDGPGRGHASLSYYIGAPPVGLTAPVVEAAVAKALSAWSSVADITFTRTQVPHQTNSIDITFAQIDGPGGTLAQAYLPSDVNRGSIAGDVQFDAAESWEVGNSRGNSATDLVWVAVHEIGHALGMDHSKVVGSVMAPSVSPNQQFTALAPADVDAALALYAVAPSSSPTSAGTGTTPSGSGTRENTTPATRPGGITPTGYWWSSGFYYGWMRRRGWNGSIGSAGLAGGLLAGNHGCS